MGLLFERRKDRYEKKTLYWAETAVKTANKPLGSKLPLQHFNQILLFKLKVGFHISDIKYSNQWTTVAYNIIQLTYNIIQLTYNIIQLTYNIIQLTCRHLRQKSRLEMNRRMRWNQTPPNLDDYHPDCLAVGTGPLQQAPAMDDANTKSTGNKRGAESLNMHTPRGKAPKPSPNNGDTGMVSKKKGVYFICNHVNDVFVTWTLVVNYPHE